MEFNIGDKVKIRSLEKFELIKRNEKGFLKWFIEKQKDYSNKEAIIIDKLLNEKSNQWMYKLNIDHGKEYEWLWQDYMFDLNYLFKKSVNNYCNTICKLEKCDEYCMLNVDNKITFNTGDKIKVRSYEWFRFNYTGRYKIMSDRTKNFLNLISNKIYTITESTYNENYKQWIYKLNLDNNSITWFDYMFDLDSITFKLKNFCKFGCLYECKKDKCPIYKN